MTSPLPHRARSPRLAVSLLFIFTLTALALAGCAKDQAQNAGATRSVAPATHLIGPNPPGNPIGWWDMPRRGGRRLYPLAVGNHWDYMIHATTTLITDAGVQPPVSSDSPWMVEITGETVVERRRYFLQAESDPRAMSPVPQAVYYVRQDWTGLYELDQQVYPLRGGRTSGTLSPLAARLLTSVERMPGAAAHPAAFRRAAIELAQRVDGLLHSTSAAGSPDRPIGPPLAGEITMLQYPLHVGASWIVRESPRFARRVTARERLEVPAGRYAAWRIAGLSEFFGPNDRVNFWYGDAGLLRILVHAETNATDDAGNIIGTMLLDSDQVLTAAQLHGPRPLPGFSAEETGGE